MLGKDVVAVGFGAAMKNKWIAYGKAKTCGNPMKTCMCRTGY